MFVVSNVPFQFTTGHLFLAVDCLIVYLYTELKIINPMP